jgi:hypothetical protein
MEAVAARDRRAHLALVRVVSRSLTYGETVLHVRDMTYIYETRCGLEGGSWLLTEVVNDSEGAVFRLRHLWPLQERRRRTA